MAQVHSCDRCLRLMPLTEVRSLTYKLDEYGAGDLVDIKKGKLVDERKEFCKGCAADVVNAIRTVVPHKDGMTNSEETEEEKTGEGPNETLYGPGARHDDDYDGVRG